MEEISALFGGFAVAMTPFNLLLMLVGVTLGVIIGVLPGLGGANGIAILLPLTFTMPPTSAIIMLSCIYWGALFVLFGDRVAAPFNFDDTVSLNRYKKEPLDHFSV